MRLSCSVSTVWASRALPLMRTNAQMRGRFTLSVPIALLVLLTERAATRTMLDIFLYSWEDWACSAVQRAVSTNMKRNLMRSAILFFI
jgi:hypothetical protein